MQRIPDETLEQIAAANDIVEVIGSYFPLKRAGGAYKALCPFHQERSPSFTVNPQKQLFKCFGCGAGGSVFRFVMDYEHLTFIETVRKLGERAGIRLVEQELTPADQERVDLRRRLLGLHAAAAEWFHLQLLRTPAAQAARDYLKGRGFTAEVAKGWRLGYAPDGWDNLGPWALRQGYTVPELLKSGLVARRGGEEEPEEQRDDEEEAQFYDRFRHRIMFPICNDRGEVIAFSGRTLEANPKAAKYVNSPETPLFVKGQVLFGLHRTVRALIEKKSAIVCEGQIDTISLVEGGVPNVIAPQGTAFTEQQARILKRYVEEVVLCFDSDAAGEKAAEKSLEMLLAENLTVRVAAMPPGEDPDSLIRRDGSAAFVERIAGAKDFFAFQIERLAQTPEFQTPRGRANAGHKLAGWVGFIKDGALRESVMGHVTQRLEISMREFQKMLERAARPRSRAETNEPKPENQATPLTDPAFRLLALAALHDREACDWLRQAPYRELLAREPEAGLVLQILESDFQPDERGSQSGFLTSLPAADEATITELLNEKAPAHAEMQASDCWNALVRRQLQRHLETLQARLRAPGLPLEETLRLQKEVLDHQTTLLDIARPLSPPLA